MGKKNFKVGDKVVVVTDRKAGGDYDVNLKGKVGEVVEPKSGFNGERVLCRFDGFNGHNGNGATKRGRNYDTNDHWYVSPEDIKIAKEKIVIYRNGSETIAENKLTGKAAVAKCSPDDTYDFMTGAKLAFGRLTGLTGSIIEVKRNAQIGEYIKIVNADNSTQNEYENGDILKVVDTNCYGNAYYKNEQKKYAKIKEYVVLEGYQPPKEYTETKKLYNGKVVCVDNINNPDMYTVGKIYQFKNGRFRDDTGKSFPLSQSISSFEEWQLFTKSKFIEIVE